MEPHTNFFFTKRKEKVLTNLFGPVGQIMGREFGRSGLSLMKSSFGKLQIGPIYIFMFLFCPKFRVNFGK